MVDKGRGNFGSGSGEETTAKKGHHIAEGDDKKGRQFFSERSLYVVVRPSVVCLSSVTFLRPTQAYLGNGAR